MEASKKLNNLIYKLKDMDSVLIAFSGGVDSTFLLKLAHDILGEKCIAVTIHTMMHSNREIKEAMEFTKSLGIRHIVLEIDKLEINEVIENVERRCYYCKKYIFENIKKVAKNYNINYILDGTNLDDLKDYRPGLKALEELNIKSPLKDCLLTKDDIRILSKNLKIPTYNKPAFACLATRIPYGEKITNEKLRMVEKGEEYLQDLGFKQFRVRLHKNLARIEVQESEIDKFFNKNLLKSTYNKFKEIGFEYVTLDLLGYRMGNMNDNLNQQED